MTVREIAPADYPHLEDFLYNAIYIPPGEEWHTRTWKINDACFIGKWGWRFQVNAEMSAGDVQVQEIRIKKIK